MPADKEELRARIEKLATALVQTGLDAALIRFPLHIFYFAGVFVDGHLVITERAEAFLLVYRTLGRPEKSPVAEEIPFRSLRKLPAFLKDLGLHNLGLEEERLPHALFKRYQQLLTDFSLADVSPLVQQIRSVKSPYEISCLKQAARLLAEALVAFLPRLKPGLSELEAAGLLEAELRKRGHPAFTRTSGFGQELAYGHLLAGKEATVPAYTTTGQGGLGVWGFPQGPSEKKIGLNEPILIDYAGWFEGYLVDQSRVFYFGQLPPRAHEIYEKIDFILQEIEKMLQPGTSGAEIYQKALSLAADNGLSPYFMAHGPEKVPFIGHGVGLEIDEWPPIAQVDVALQEGMVIALEPKCHVPGLGVIGVEDTYLITSSGPERLTVFPRGLQRLNF